MTNPAYLLKAYDEQLRTDSETPGARDVARLGPLRLVSFAGGRGFITYGPPTGADAEAMSELVPTALDHFRSDPEIGRVEWKTRGHDHTPGLLDALSEHGFIPDAPESIMIGEARLLAVDIALPAGVTIRRVTLEADVRAMSAMQDEVFGDPVSSGMADALLRRLAGTDGIQLWIAEAEGQIVCAGFLEPVEGTSFAGIWAGATRPEWRRRGIYRALTAQRARSAIELGKTLINSDSTEYSRPILERSGLLRVSTTTPYRWRR